MSTLQLVVAGVIAFVIVLPVMILLNPPTAWVKAIWGEKK
jgi:hypothetical protein